MAKTAWDGAAIVYSSAVVLYLLGLCAGLVATRRRPFMAARGARFLAIMCAAGVVHVVSATVGHRHDASMDALEELSCSLWGYWIPYVSVGVWFTALYLQVVTYTLALTRHVSFRGLARILKLRPFFGVITLLPPIIFSAIATSGGSRADGACASVLALKVCIATWLVACMVVLSLSLIWFRRMVPRDAVREFPRHWIVLVACAVAVAAQVYVTVVASRGLDYVANRVLATLVIGALYTVTMSVLALRPLWKVFSGDKTYQDAEDHKLATTQQTIDSVLRMVENSYDNPSRSVRIIVADFVSFCAEHTQPWCDRGHGITTHPAGLVALYVSMDAWTQRALGSANDYTASPYGRRDAGGFPPLFSQDIVRTAQEIVQFYFPPPYGTALTRNDDSDESSRSGAPTNYGPLCLDEGIVRRVVETMRTAEVATLFQELMWWVLDTLDTFHGSRYLTVHLMRRDIYAQNVGVREVLVSLLRAESHAHLELAGVRVRASAQNLLQTSGAGAVDLVELEETDSD